MDAGSQNSSINAVLEGGLHITARHREVDVAVHNQATEGQGPEHIEVQLDDARILLLEVCDGVAAGPCCWDSLVSWREARRRNLELGAKQILQDRRRSTRDALVHDSIGLDAPHRKGPDDAREARRV